MGADPRSAEPVGYARSLVELLTELRGRDPTPSYREIAQRIPSKHGKGTSAGYVSEVLHGKRVPSGDMAAAIAQALQGDCQEQNRARRYAEEAAADKRRSPAQGNADAAVRGAPAEAVDLPPPQQLPGASSVFTGRSNELAALTHLCHENADTTAVAVISGMAGVGKTTLAVYWAHQVADRFPDGQLYVDLRGFDPSGPVADPASAIRSFLDALHVPPQRIPVGLDDQARLYRTLLAGRRMLVVLDNARDAAQVRPLVPGAPGCFALVTSRNQLTGLIADGARPLPLDVLSFDEACQLLAGRLGDDRVAAEPQASKEIITRCARLPLALAVVSARATMHPQFPLQILASELRDSRDPWDALTGDEPAIDVRAVFSWSYRALTPGAARIFRLLGVHPGPDISASAAASLAGLTSATVRPPLAELVWANMVIEHAPGRYALHDLLRAYAAEQAHNDEPDDQRRAAVHRVLDHYVHAAHAADRLLNPARDPVKLSPMQADVTGEVFGDHEQALAWFTAEHAVLLAAVDHAVSTGHDAHAWQLAWALVNFLERRGHWPDLTATAHAAMAAAQRLADRPAQARAHHHLARACYLTDRLDEANTHLAHALDLYRSVGDQAGQAHTHINLAYVYGRLDRMPEALLHARQALDLYQAAGHSSGTAHALNSVGWYHAQLGDHQKALIYCQRALTLHEQSGDRQGQAATLAGLGYAHHHLGHHSQAITCYESAIDLFRKLGHTYCEADALAYLGDTHHQADDPDKACAAWQDALAILDDLAHPDAGRVRAKLNGPSNPS